MSKFKIVTITEQAEVLMGQSPPSSVCSELGEGIPFIQGNAEFGVRHPAPRLKCSSPTRLAEAGDLLLSVRAPVGALNQAVEQTVIGRGLSALRFQPKDRGYAWHAVNWSSIALNRVAQGSTFVAVSRHDVEKLKIPWHGEVNERIAYVLDTVDKAIAKTEAVIAKLKQVRAGMLHDLLTCGLDENGQLRDPIAHPEQFKDSTLGRIPTAWSVLPLEALLDHVPNPIRSGPFGSALLKQELKPSGIPLLGIDNVHVERFAADFIRFVGYDKYLELKRYTVRPRDLMITIMGTVGRCCVVPESIGTALSSKHVWTITLDVSRYLPDIACWQINYAPWILKQLRKDEQGGVMASIRSETLRSLMFPVPSPSEMKAFEQMLYALNGIINREKESLHKLESIKPGLMTDLLTGTVRVPEDVDFLVGGKFR